MSQVEIEDFAALTAARELWSKGQAEQALEAFGRAIETRPNNVRALIEFADVMGKCYQVEFAEELLESAEELASNVPDVLVRVASTYNRIYRARRAIAIFERVRVANGLTPPQLGELSLLYEQCNLLEQAHETISECISVAGDQLEPKLILARLLRLRGQPDRSEQLVVDELLGAVDTSPLLRARAWTELCLAHDIQGNYAAAVDAIEQAKSMQRQFPEVVTLRNRNRAIGAALRLVYEEIGLETLARWSSECVPFDEQCGGVTHLIGFPRSGTTLLERILAAHPAIESSPERAIFADQILPMMCQTANSRELSFAALDGISKQQLPEVRSLYLQCHQSVQGRALAGRMLLDKNPNHTSLIAGLYRLVPEARFIFAVRDPRDVIVSNYLRYFPLNEFSSSFLTWEDTVQQYVSDMNIWLSFRELLPGNWIEIRYEDTVADMERQARRAFRLCDLEWDESVRNYRTSQQQRIVNSPSRAEVAQPIYSQAIGRWKNYSSCIEPFLDHLSPMVDAFGYV